ncbi:MAG: hypothetical protein K9I68_00390 [Bacteroidales bacterium]|nr:hypothetical protein [Bacteroidales bacterium]MCF8336436.1 hypothetical protein [Bacteroidales bacterium]
MTDEHEEIRQFLDSIPDNFQILEEGIDFDLQKKYLDYSHSFERGELTEDEINKIGRILHNPEVPDEGKKKGLTILAHVGTISAYKQINKYYENADGTLKKWSALALQECKMFLESELTDESAGFISTGLGGTNDKLRIYFLVLPHEGYTFDQKQHKIIENEVSHRAKELDCYIENFDFQDNYVGLTVLVPMDVAVATFIDTGIKYCNALGNFVFEHYYAANTKIPDEKEIEEIIKIVREG